jgi:ABC-type antimicrobial peptide transport system permease subunit
LLALVMLQTLVIAFLGLGIAIALAYLAQIVIPAIAPEIALAYPLGSIIKLVLASLIIAAIAALLPAYRITRVEPGIVFKG